MKFVLKINHTPIKCVLEICNHECHYVNIGVIDFTRSSQ